MPDEAPAPATEIAVRFGDRQFAGLAWGPETGPRVLALHGWLDNAASFALLAPALKTCRVVALDFPGHGKSPHRGDGYYHFVEYVLDVAAAAAGLGWARFSLLGHSMGAGVATLFAGSFPEAVERVALVEGLGALTSRAADLPAALRKTWDAEQQRLRRSPTVYPSFEDAVAARCANAAGGARISREAATLLGRRGIVEVPGGWRWRHDPRLMLPSPQRLTESQVLAFIAAIRAPVLVIRAASGLPFDEAAMTRRLEVLADGRVIEIEGHHHLHMEASAPEVAAAVRAHFS